jgi:YfiH family protein
VTSLLDHCVLPDWPAPATVKALVTTRVGGTSTGPYASLNLGTAVGDDPVRVAENRARLRTLLPDEPRWLRQVHGTRVVAAESVRAPEEADAAVTRRPAVVCVAQMADCLPVLLTSRDGSAVGAAHAGWRGLAAGVVERTVEALGTRPAELLAWLGPAIGPDAFEVGDEVREAFVRHDPGAARAFVSVRAGKWLADLYALARMRLEAAGVGAVHGGGWCTFGDATHFFSHRRDGVTGRMAALVWREA